MIYMTFLIIAEYANRNKPSCNKLNALVKVTI